MRDDWEIKKLDDISEIMYGHTSKSSGDFEGPRYLRITDIKEGTVNWETVPFCKPIGDDYEKYKLKYGDIVFARTGATTGKSFLITDPPEAVFASYLIRVQAKIENILPEYLYMYFQSPDYWNTIKKGISGSAQGGFNATKLGNLALPVPPIDEQKRIVSILDEAFEAIDQAKANIERNIENAEKLFQSKLNNIFENKAKEWETNKLGEACEINMGQSPKGSTYNDQADGTPLINGPVEFGPKPFSKTVKSKWTTEPNKMCQKDDLILCVRGSTTGRINIAGFDACIGRGVASLRYKRNQKWLNYFIRAKQDFIYNLGSGSTFPNVSGKDLKKIDFPTPPLDIQQPLVKVMDSLLVNRNMVVKVYKEKVDLLNEFQKSILQRAFSGELTQKEELVA